MYRELAPHPALEPFVDRLWSSLHVAGSEERLVAVRFRPGGAAGFLRLPVDQIRDRVVEAEELRLAWLVPQRLAECADLVGATLELQAQLLGCLAGVPAPQPLVAFAVQKLFEPGAPTIGGLEGATGVSRQYLARLFRVQVGISPKRLLRVARLQRALVELRLEPRLAAAAQSLGYSDEAHMARDFRELTGLSPGRARAALGSIFPIHSLLDAAQPGS